MSSGESESFHQRAGAARDDDAFPRLEDFEAGFVEMIEMRVADEYEVDFRQAAQIQARHPEAAHRSVPTRPIRVDDDRVAGKLEEK